MSWDVSFILCYKPLGINPIKIMQIAVIKKIILFGLYRVHIFLQQNIRDYWFVHQTAYRLCHWNWKTAQYPLLILYPPSSYHCFIQKTRFNLVEFIGESYLKQALLVSCARGLTPTWINSCIFIISHRTKH